MAVCTCTCHGDSMGDTYIHLPYTLLLLTLLTFGGSKRTVHLPEW